MLIQRLGALLLIAGMSIGGPASASEAQAAVAIGPTPMWSGMPSDDDGNDAYDRVTGLGTAVNCFRKRAGTHVQSIEYSFSRSRPLHFFSDVVRSRDVAPHVSAVVPLRTLTPARPVVVATRIVPTCDEAYSVFITYPK